MSLRSLTAGLTLVLAASVPVPAAAQSAADTRSCPVVAGRTAAPSPSAVLGRPLASRPPSPTDTTRVLAAIDRASPRVTVGVAGRSGEGRPLSYAIVGDPALLSPGRRAAIERHARAIRTGSVGPVATRRATRGPAIVWLGGGVHANEPSGTTALLETVHRLATDESCATRRILRNVLTVVMPDQNPDGHARGTRTDAAGFDLNRDWAAAARPETQARRELLRRLPPVIAIDLHEQTGRGYFTPPYETPILAGLPAEIRRFADGTVAPAVATALRRSGAQVVSGDGFDLLFPGYADSATSLLFGAGGMTFEQGSDLPLRTKTARHATAALTALRTVAERRAPAIAAWAAGFRSALAAGARGRTTTGRTVSAWVLRTDRRAADARRLAQRLRDVDVEVRTLRRPVTVERYRDLGGRSLRRERLPAGSLIVPADQPLQRWPDVLLGREPTSPARSDTWSLARLAAVGAGIAASPIPSAATAPLTAPRTEAIAADRWFAFASDSAAAAGTAVRLLSAGVAVVLRGDGRFATPADATAGELLRRAHVAVTSTPADDPGATELRAPHVVVLADDGPAQIGRPALLPGSTGDQPSGWIPATLRAAGVTVDVQTAGQLALGVLPGVTHVIVGPGSIASGHRGPALTASLRAFAAAGGRLLAVGAEGQRTLAELGLSAVRAGSAPTERWATAVPAAPTGTVAARTLGGATRVVVHGDASIVAPLGAATLLQTAASSVLGPTATPLVVVEPHGAGRVVTLGFSPVFRGQSDGGLRVLLGLLLD